MFPSLHFNSLSKETKLSSHSTVQCSRQCERVGIGLSVIVRKQSGTVRKEPSFSENVTSIQDQVNPAAGHSSRPKTSELRPCAAYSPIVGPFPKRVGASSAAHTGLWEVAETSNVGFWLCTSQDKLRFFLWQYLLAFC